MSETLSPHPMGAAPPVHAPDCLDCADADPRVVALLTATVARWPEVPHEIQARLAATIPPALGRAVGRSPGGRLRRVVSRPVVLIAAAAAAVLLATILPTQFDGARPAVAASYTAAVSALRNARSLHYLDYRRNPQSGQLELVGEMWYSRELGRFENRLPGPERKLFLSDVEWTVFPEPQIAVKRPLTQSPDWYLEEFADNMYLSHADRAKHDASGDMTIGGVPCRLFVATSDAVTTQPSLTPEQAGLVYLWVDPQGAVRRCESHWFCEGAWRTTWRDEVEFDVPIDPALFSTEFTKTYRIIEPDKVLSEMFDLARADAVYEVNGGIVAFHNTVRLPGDRLATTVTFRLSERTAGLLRESTDPRLKYGSVLPLQLYYTALGEPERPTVIGEVRDRAMDAIWLVLEAPSREPFDTFRIHLQVHDRSDDGQLAKIAGLEPYVMANLTLSARGRPERDSGNLADSFYDQFERLATFRPAWIYIGYGDPLSDMHTHSHAQGCAGGLTLRISRQAFRDALTKAWSAPE